MFVGNPIMSNQVNQTKSQDNYTCERSIFKEPCSWHILGKFFTLASISLLIGPK